MFSIDEKAQEQLEQGAVQMGFELSEQQVSLMCRYLELLHRWSRLFNLTGVPPNKWIAKHLLDSLSACQFMPKAGQEMRCIDIGSGAGLPGIPLAIAMNPTYQQTSQATSQPEVDPTSTVASSAASSDASPAVNWYLLEKSTKKCGFLLRVKAELGLDNINVVNTSAENLNLLLRKMRSHSNDKPQASATTDNENAAAKAALLKQEREVAFGGKLPAVFDLAIGRSIFGSDGLLEHCHPMLKDDGVILDMHGKYSGKPQDREQWRVDKFEKVRVPYLQESRHIIRWVKLSS
ncbi:MAG: 16S rRNA (guanine(527)-N(7))-methyltransferase RsmG [Gammaproteobacteria bacterium]|nr:16S rRNA (guanine(527)-N(7))-methyltransferase RsmG [Gammaproteobacteria bacterium]